MVKPARVGNRNKRTLWLTSPEIRHYLVGLYQADCYRRNGCARGDARCHYFVPAGHWKTVIFIAELRVDGLTAPWCLNQAMNGEAFKDYFRSQLGPTLKAGNMYPVER